MSKTIIIDPGHGGTDPGAVGFGVREKDWNLRISLYQYNRLKELGAKVGITRTSDVTLDSVPRTNKIKNKYDICISNHWNAFNGTARGVETIHSIHGGKEFATKLANAIVKASGLTLRRVFSRKNSSGTDYYFMHRLTGSTTTIIVEYGFLDNVTDHNWYKNDSNFIKAAEAVIEEACKEIGVKYVAPGGAVKPAPASKPATGKLYRVQAGAFSESKNAEKLHEKMEANGIDAFVVQEGKLFKVQAGAYGVKANAEAQLKKVQKVVGDGFIVESGETKPVPKPTPAPKPKVKTVDELIKEVEKGDHGNGETRKRSLGNRYDEVQAEINRRDAASKPKAINVGSKVKLKSSAIRYATGQVIPGSIKNKTYTIMQKGKRNGKNQVLLKEIMSWVWESDVQ